MKATGKARVSAKAMRGAETSLPDVVAIAFREPVDEKRPLPHFQQHQDAEAAGLSASLASDPLVA